MKWPFNKTNYVIFGIGILSIIIGYVVIAVNSVDSYFATKLGPLILFIGYCFILPYSIIYNGKK
tara:strand:- start:457 stop:648 length:192 start_codon:yes stop_codon:yes gene_type:complete